MATTPTATHSAWVGLGANLGDARATLAAALADLAAHPGVAACHASSLYRSAPVEADGPDYLNAVARLTTTLAPLALLDVLQEIERQHGRQRPYRNAPRTLDLDLIGYDTLTLAHPRLTLPHPRAHLRAFVLVPLAELAHQLAHQHAHQYTHQPAAPLPSLAGQPYTHWLAACAGQRVEIIPNTPPPHAATPTG